MFSNGMEPITTENVLDSRDIIARINYLTELQLDDIIDPEEAIELDYLTAVEEAAACVSQDWAYGAQLIRADYFVEFARQHAEETCGRELQSAVWPLTHIDWEAAADALAEGYEAVYMDGVEYYILYS